MISATAGLVLLIPMIILGIIVWRESKGSAIYKQECLGLNGKPFIMYKFRPMHIDAEVNGARWAARGDDRCNLAASCAKPGWMNCLSC